MALIHIADGFVSGVAAVVAFAICGVPAWFTFRAVQVGWPRPGLMGLSRYWRLWGSSWLWLLGARPWPGFPPPATDAVEDASG